MKDATKKKPTIKEASISDMHLLRIGIYNASQAGGLTKTFMDVTKIPVPENVKPFDTNRTLNVFNKFLDDRADGFDTSNLPPKIQNALKAHFNDLGVAGVLDDGVIDPKEFVLIGAAAGNKDLLEHPEKYQNLTQEEYQAAQELLEKHGVEDPDGILAKGLAANMERIAQRTNVGLGFTPNGDPVLKAPVAEVASVPIPAL